MVAREIVFCALETYSLVGGLQHFNRRVIRHLSGLGGSSLAGSATVLLMRDNPNACPDLPHVQFVHAGANRLAFATKFLRKALSADVLLLGHINILPLGFLARCLRPTLPILLFVHGDEVWNATGHRAKRWYEPFMLKAVTRVAAVSNYTAGRMAPAYDVSPEKFALFPNAVDAIANLPPKTGGVPTILTVTRIGPADREKNVDRALKAFAKISNQFPDAVYEIVGDGGLRPELEALARDLGVADRVKFLGRVDDAGLQAAYGRADVFVLPSSKEGFGIVYLEAWQRGLPVICSTEGASSEIVSDGVDGFAIDPNGIDGFAERIAFLLSDREAARKFGERGRQKVNERYLDVSFGKRLAALLAGLRGSMVANT